MKGAVLLDPVRRGASTAPHCDRAWQGDQEAEVVSNQVSRVYLTTCLRLLPSDIEQEFWQSTSVRLLRLIDAICLCNSALTTIMLIRTFGLSSLFDPDMAWHNIPVLSYLLLALLQLAFLVATPGPYQQHRLGITLANRLVRLVSFTVGAASMGRPATLARMTAAANNIHRRSNSWPVVLLLRPMVGPPLVWLSHALNFPLPFWMVLPLHLYMLGASLPMVRSTVCTLAASEDQQLQATAVVACQRLKVACSSAMMVLGVQAGHTTAAGTTCCPVMDALLWLTLYTYVVLLLLLPCMAMYLVERSLKLGFLRGKGLGLQGPGRVKNGSRMVRMLVVYTALLLSCLLCGHLVAVLAPSITCPAVGHAAVI